MVLESLIGPAKAERHPYWLLVYGLIYASFGILLALWVFKSQASMVMVFLTVFACMPLVYRTLKYEEKKDMRNLKEKVLIKEHGKALKFLMFLFFGFILAYTLWFVFMPKAGAESLFDVQLKTIETINAGVTGRAYGLGTLIQILANNVKVLLFCILFAFFYGAGTIFILTWNASVIGAAIGTFVHNKLADFGSYFVVIPIALMRYMTHGVFEILAYFTAGLAGGIISVAVINHDVDSQRFRHVLVDSLDLLLLSIGLLIVAALIEVYITPVFF
ncbi:MAG TPA: stage II sporulation protein M [Candidatus Nanoarchaeia archaeon]|nr:stage II sporulation protein M [Candidatus Nanoarchaeia archaeon]